MSFRLSFALFAFPCTLALGPPNASYLFNNPPAEIISANSALRIPSIHESTVQARRILHLSSIATLSTVFPPATSHAAHLSDADPLLGVLESRPASVAGAPIGLMEYFALCGPEPTHPTILGVTIATTMKNAAAGSNVTLALRWQIPPTAPQPPPDPWAYLPANLPRFALVGQLEQLSEDEIRNHSIKECFLRTHPEAAIWAPGTDIHESWWGRVRVNEVYFFGGFGDRARIGWLPIDEWHGISKEEVEQYRMVGEEGYQPVWETASEGMLTTQGKLR